MTSKNEALAQFLEINIDDVRDGDLNEYEIDEKTYMVLTDDEANDVVKEYIIESVWSFTPYFLAKHTGIDEEIFEVLQLRAEDCNDVILRSIKNIDEFIDDAVASDGRGHFLSQYDGNELELENDLFAYRKD